MGRSEHPLLDGLQWLSSLRADKKDVLDGYHVASNKMALKMVIDAGKLNRVVHWLGDAKWMRVGRVWSAA